jgi:hypothetical protein
MTTNEAPNQDCAKNKCRGYKHTLEQPSTVLTFSVLNIMTDNPFKIQSVAKRLLSQDEAEQLSNCLGGKKYDKG